MLSVDRSNYTPRNPYTDAPQAIGHQATISAPHMHAHALELLERHLRPGMRALDVGSGSGYLSAVMARMVGEEGKVIGIDYLWPLVDLAVANVHKADADLLNSGTLQFEQGDGWKGYEKASPFDAIHVGAAAERLPQRLQRGALHGPFKKNPPSHPSTSIHLHPHPSTSIHPSIHFSWEGRFWVAEG
ncbi:unnamed protein product [Effrenium voratum]|nr:unnamed protein product [Effrenium voratum]